MFASFRCDNPFSLLAVLSSIKLLKNMKLISLQFFVIKNVPAFPSGKAPILFPLRGCIPFGN
jgi:hypothetical protein